MVISDTESRHIGLPPSSLRRRCDPAALALPPSMQLPVAPALIGQPRAAEALAFGLATTAPGFNIYAAGPPGTGKQTSVLSFLQEAARRRRALGLVLRP